MYLDVHGLAFETSICYWQDQPGISLVVQCVRRLSYATALHCTALPRASAVCAARYSAVSQTVSLHTWCIAHCSCRYDLSSLIWLRFDHRYCTLSAMM